MRLSLALFLSLLCLPALAKKDKPTQFPQTAVTVGNTVAGKPVAGAQFSFPYVVMKAEEDTAGNLVLLTRQMEGKKYRNNGHMFSMNPGTGQVNWLLDVKRFHVRYTNDYVLYDTDEGTRVFDKYTGKPRQTLHQSFAFYSYSQNRGINHGLRMIDLGTNKEVWKSKLKMPPVWEQTERLTDSTMLISAGGVHYLNLHTGRGWSFALPTTKDDYSSAIGVAVAGIALGVLTGVMVVPTDVDHITGLSSNMLIDPQDGSIYYSSLRSLVRLSARGELRWEHEMNKKESSSSYLWLEGDKLIRVNRGYAYFNGAITEVGVPYIAAYDKRSGKQLYIRAFLKKEVISSFHSLDSNTLMRAGDQLCLFDHETGKQVLLKPVPEKLRNMDISSVNGYYTSGTSNTVQSLAARYPDHFFMESDSVVYRITRDFKVIDSFKTADLWTLEAEEEGVQYLRRDDELLVVENDTTIATLHVPGSLLFTRNSLILIDDERLTLVPFTNILGGSN